MSSESVSFFRLRFLFFIIRDHVRIDFGSTSRYLQTEKPFPCLTFQLRRRSERCRPQFICSYTLKNGVSAISTFFGPVIGKLQMKTEHSRVCDITPDDFREREKNKPCVHPSLMCLVPLIGPWLKGTNKSSETDFRLTDDNELCLNKSEDDCGD